MKFTDDVNELNKVSIVPPEAFPYISSKQLILCNFSPYGKDWFNLKVIKSHGIESAPQQLTIEAPVF